MNIDLRLGDCLEVLKTIPDNSIDAVITDPPYGLSFMGKKWDYDVPSVEVWTECFRVLKPGGHLLSFAGSRTYHRMAVRIEDAGFEIRDQIMWVYGSGFPKSHNIGKAIDANIKTGKSNPKSINQSEMSKTDGDVVTVIQPNNGILGEKREVIKNIGASLETEQAKNWEGWGTALKPAHEPIVMARKPISEKSIAENVLKHGTGAINIDGSRIVDGDDRFPANIIFDEEAGQLLDKQSDKASRFFYCPKAAKKDKDEGLDNFEEKAQRVTSGGTRDFNARCANCGKKFIGSPTTICDCDNPVTDNQVFKKKNNHPTVKPTDLMRYLINLVTPPNATILDPFMGSGSTGKAAVRCGLNFIGIEKEQEYMDIAKARIEHEKNKPVQTKLL
jgi:site-specific DNA-methyltransferase (adenine-specific)